MLLELRVENLLLIERAGLGLAPGLNVLTGETGAGKTVLAHALDLLLGGKPRSGIVRPGAAEAYVEGVFELSEAARAVAGERLAPDAEELVLARRVSAEGRTRAYVNGRSASAGDLRELGAGLLSFYGQHEHRRLTLASAQLEIVDSFCGAPQAARRAAFGRAFARERALRAEMEALRARAGSRERELDLLEWELAEIEQAAPSEAEEASLMAERERLRHLEGLLAAAGAGLEALAAESGDEGACVALAGAARALEAMRGVDPALDVLASRAGALAVEADDLAGELRRYREGVEVERPAAADRSRSAGGDPSRAAVMPPRGLTRLDEVEDRLEQLERLKRKHGGTLALVVAHAEACRTRMAELAGAEEALEGLERELTAAQEALDAGAAELRGAREAAVGGLGAAVRERLAGLAMANAAFTVALSPRDGYGPAGGDEIEFLIAPNPGVPAGPLRDIASGGEVSRVMLALMSVAAEAGPATLVFDEVDAGIGGQTARAVGEQLRALAAGRQVVCITHLPQIASLADRHFTVVKDARGGATGATVFELGRREVVGELVRMLGADRDDRAARRHAEELLKAA